jgi:hypothetical protein
MAETTKEQAKNSEIRSKNTEKTLKSEKGITAEKREQQRITDEDVKQGFDLSKIIEENAKKQKASLEFRQDAAKRIKELNAQEARAREMYFGQNQDLQDSILAGINEERDSLKAGTMAAREKSAERRLENEILEDNQFIIEQSAENAKKLGDNIENFVKKLPGGEALTKALGIDGLGDFLQKDVGKTMVNSLISGGDATEALDKGMGKLRGKGKQVLGNAKGLGKTLFRLAAANPFTALAAAAVGVFLAVRKIRQAARDLGEELGASTSQSMKLLGGLKLQEQKFKALGLDSTKLKTTLGTIADEFGNLENVTAANAASVERMAQNLGVAGTEVVKFNKVMTDLTGMTFDQATATAQAAANLAKQENVATGKVLKDISSNAADFARFSMDGAEGLAKAAVEAAKVGTNIGEIVKAADNLLNFEDSITKQFEAQVLTGRQINTERARQLALDGDIAGLTTEIQSIVGQVGDIQSLNVIQRKSVADAIGISVEDLLKISRGEAAQATATVQDKLDITNKLLAQQLGVNEEQLENMGKPVEMSGGII